MKRKHNRPAPEEGQLKNPHDHFLKLTLKDLTRTLATLKGILPPMLYDRLQPETLTRADTSYIDTKLHAYFSDIVYTCLTHDDTPVQIAFLFEHKSYPPDFPHLQILRYMLEIWEREAREKQPLSFIIPILLYHGKEAWEYRSFHDYFAGEMEAGFAVYAPLFDFLTLNLQAATFEEITQRFRLPALHIAFRLMKAIRDEDLPEKISIIFEGLREIRKQDPENTFFDTLFVYLLYGSKTDGKKIMKNMYNLIQEEWEFGDSTAMQLIRMGKEEGREEAWAEAEKKIAEARKKVETEARLKAEAQRKDAEQKIAEAQRKEAEAQRKEAEAQRKEAEAQRKEAEAQRKADAEKKASIAKMLNAGIERSAIAEFLGLSRPKLAAYIRQILKDPKGK